MTMRVFWGLIVFLTGLLMAILGWVCFENRVLIVLFILAGILLMDLGLDHLLLKLKKRRF